jgi:hypothetical protein
MYKNRTQNTEYRKRNGEGGDQRIRLSGCRIQNIRKSDLKTVLIGVNPCFGENVLKKQSQFIP